MRRKRRGVLIKEGLDRGRVPRGATIRGRRFKESFYTCQRVLVGVMGGCHHAHTQGGSDGGEGRLIGRRRGCRRRRRERRSKRNMRRTRMKGRRRMTQVRRRIGRER